MSAVWDMLVEELAAMFSALVETSPESGAIWLTKLLVLVAMVPTSPSWTLFCCSRAVVRPWRRTTSSLHSYHLSSWELLLELEVLLYCSASTSAARVTPARAAMTKDLNIVLGKKLLMKSNWIRLYDIAS